MLTISKPKCLSIIAVLIGAIAIAMTWPLAMSSKSLTHIEASLAQSGLVKILNSAIPTAAGAGSKQIRPASKPALDYEPVWGIPALSPALAPPTQMTNVMQFSSISYDVIEDCTTVTITVNRVGDTSGAASVDYNTSDVTATERKDYVTALGNLQFAAGENSKSFAVLINEDSFVEGNETFNVNLTNPSGATLGAPAIATVTIIDDSAEPATNVNDDPGSYVCQHYHDFLNRQPDAPGLAFWTNQITSCGADAQCIEVRRINVSASFFLSIEFQETGYLIERLYKASYGDASGSSTIGSMHQLPVPIVRFTEFLLDTQKIGQGVIVGQGNWQQILEQNKQAFTAEFVQRPRFTIALPTSLTPAQFVNQLFANAGVTPSDADRNAATAEFGGAANTTDTTARSRALRRVAENSILTVQESNRAFVLMQYFGYLRRNPNDPQDTDYSGYDFWLTKLNAFNGNFINAEMVKAFITSLEYRSRFGSASTPAPTPTPTPTPGQGLTPEQRLAAWESVRQLFESLINGPNPDPNAVNQQVLNYIRTRPEFSASGVTNDSCVWATYTDGVQLIVANNRKRDIGVNATPAVNPSGSASLSPENIPNSNKARLLFALGTAFSNPLSDLRAWLTEENYTQPINEGATVAQLKTVGGDGIFYLDAHGGGEPYSLTTATEVSATLDRELDDDLHPKTVNGVKQIPRLTYFTAEWDSSLFGVTTTKVYGITSQFIKDYWGDFGPNSFVFIDACGSAGPDASTTIPEVPGIIDVIKAKKASVYAGWTKSVGNATAVNTARFVFDRLLGANKVYPESDGFKQRPFDYMSVANDFQYHGVGTDPANGSQLVFIQLSDPSQDGFELLAPSIHEMAVEEGTDTLLIFGTFGEDQGEDNRAVFVGGQKIHVQTWTPLYIACDLPRFGDGSAGEVLVTIRQQKSNAAMLSEWQGSFTHTVTGDGTLKQTATYNVRWRGDLRKVRDQIHEPPSINYVSRLMGATQDSTCVYACTGSYTVGDTTEEWSGSGTLSVLKIPPTGNGAFFTNGWVNDDHMLSMIFEVGGNLRIVTITKTGSPPFTQNSSLISPRVVPDSDGRIGFALDQNGNIIGNTLMRTDPNTGYVHKLTWTTIQNKYPPNPNSPR